MLFYFILKFGITVSSRSTPFEKIFNVSFSEMKNDSNKNIGNCKTIDSSVLSLNLLIATNYFMLETTIHQNFKDSYPIQYGSTYHQPLTPTFASPSLDFVWIVLMVCLLRTVSICTWNLVQDQPVWMNCYVKESIRRTIKEFLPEVRIADLLVGKHRLQQVWTSSLVGIFPKKLLNP